MPKQNITSRFFEFRFEIFFVTLLVILFGSLFFPFGIYDKVIEPIIFVFNLIAGVQFSRHLKRSYRFGLILIFLGVSSTLLQITLEDSSFREIMSTVRLFTYFIFYMMVTIQMINQIWFAKEVSNRVMLGLMSGYICLGLVGLFAFLTIEYFAPGSFNGLNQELPPGEQLLYLSFITLLTIGYGDILPASDIAHRAAIMIGLVGQFYLVIIMAVVLEKFIRRRNTKQETEL